MLATVSHHANIVRSERGTSGKFGNTITSVTKAMHEPFKYGEERRHLIGAGVLVGKITPVDIARYALPAQAKVAGCSTQLNPANNSL